MDQATEQPTASSYNKRPMWQWILLYVIIAVIVYGLLYYFVFAKKGSNPYSNSPQYQYPTTQQPTVMPTQSGSTQSATPSSTTQALITVTGTEFAFTPSTISVKKGQSVQLTFKNNGTYPHNFTITELNVQTKTIQPGQSDTITFTPTTTGSFTYMCTVPGHADRGMKGTLTVE